MITVKQDEIEYKPITITLETHNDAREFYELLRVMENTDSIRGNSRKALVDLVNSLSMKEF